MQQSADRPMVVYITIGSLDEARSLGRTLVDERLVACVNLIDGMRSIYRWQGEVTEDREVVIIAKTTAAAIDRLTERVRALHSYDCPCVAAMEIAGGNPAYLAWIADNVA